MASEVIPEEPESALDEADQDLGPNVFLCSSCQHYMSNTFQLICKHTFCLQCLHTFKAKSASPSMLFCPVQSCRKISTIPTEGLESLPSDKTVNDFSQILKQWGKYVAEKCLDGGEQVCSSCPEGPKKKKKVQVPTHRCCECDVYLCGKCLEVHMAEEEDTSGTHTYEHFHEHDKCCRHDNDTDQYCHECRVCICYICDVHQHVNHNKEKKILIFNQKINRSQDLLARFRDEKNLNQDRKAEVEGLGEHLLKALDDKTAEVKAHAEKARKQVDAWEKDQMVLIEEKKAVLMKKIAKSKQMFHERASFMDSVIGSGHDVINSNFRDKLLSLTRLNDTMERMTKSHFSDSSKDVSKSSMGIPVVSFHRESIQKSLGNINFGTSLSDPATSLSLSWSWLARAVGTGRQQLRHPGHVLLSTNGGVALSGQLNKCVWWFDPSDSTPQTLLHDIYPLGMGVVNNFDYLSIISDDLQKSVLTCNVPGGSVENTWQLEKQLRPSCMAYLSNGCKVILCLNNREGYIYDSNNEHVLVSFGKGLFFEAHYMCIDSKDRILVSDQEEHCVYVFDKMGCYLFDFGSYGEKDGYLNTPKGICVDSFDNIIIADQGNDRITLYDSDGDWCRHLVDKNDDVKAPFTVAYSPGTPARIAVGCASDNQLTLRLFHVEIDPRVETIF